MAHYQYPRDKAAHDAAEREDAARTERHYVIKYGVEVPRFAPAYGSLLRHFVNCILGKAN